MKVTADQCIRALRARRVSTPAATLAGDLTRELGGEVTSRAVAAALRAPVGDGRVSRRFVEGIAWYRFVRLAAKKPEAVCT